MKRIAAVAVLVCSLMVQAQGSEAPARVQCERPKGTSPNGVAAQSDEVRLAFLSKLLVEEGARAHNYTLFWGATYGVLGVAQLAAMPFFPAEKETPTRVDTNTQADFYWGAASTAFGLAFTLLGTLDVLEAGPLYAKKVSAATADDTCKLIAEGEKLLESGADAEASTFAWYLHVGNVLFNAGMGLILGLGYGHWTSAVINTLVGSAVGEANILSGPAHLIPGWKRYRLGEAPPAVTFRVIPTAGLGLGLLMTF